MALESFKGGMPYPASPGTTPAHIIRGGGVPRLQLLKKSRGGGLVLQEAAG